MGGRPVAMNAESTHFHPVRLFLCGDVMTGRGIDQVLSHPSAPELYESYVRDARDYVLLAETVHGTILRPVSSDYIWGDALGILEQVDVRIINLETSVTRSNDHWPGKPIHYRMHPENIACLSAAGINACSVANNHTLDWGYNGLFETMDVLGDAGITYSGAGHNEEEAEMPAILDVSDKGRVLLFACGSIDSGIPRKWAVSHHGAGLNVLPNLHETTAAKMADRMRQMKRPGDISIASIHWGSNWGYDIPEEHVLFAHKLVDEGFDIVHGHSSHHAKGIEVYRDRLILYGCGDFITDYEGISGYEMFRGDLALMYLATVNSESGQLVGLQLVPMQMHRFRLQRASENDVKWIGALLNRVGERFGTRFVFSREERALELVRLA